MLFPGNPWRCVCGEEWLPEWLGKMGRRVIGLKDMGCMATSGCGEVSAEDDEKGSVWIAIVASALAVVSLLILIAIGFLYLDEGRYKDGNNSCIIKLLANHSRKLFTFTFTGWKMLLGKLRRASSDLEWLIPRDSLNISSQDTGKESLLRADNKPKPLLLLENQPKPTSILSQSPTKNVQPVSEKKRVRFQ